MGKPKEDAAPLTDGSNGDDQLLSDIKAFAAQLGFGSLDSDAAFDDFAPSKAKKKISIDKSSSEIDTYKSPKESDPQKKKKATQKDTPNSNAKKQSPAIKTTAPQPSLPPSLPTGQQTRSLLTKEPPGLWWEASSDLPKPKPGARPPNQDLIQRYNERATQLLANEATAFHAASQRQKGNSNLQWLQQVQRGGTTSDKVAALAVLVQESPVSNIKSLEDLVTLSGKKGGARAVVGTSLDALKELWVDVLLPDGRKLRFFEQQPLPTLAGKENEKKPSSQDRILLYWAFEDALKRLYATFVETLERLSRDNLEFVKDKAAKTAYDLLSSRPEQEAALLSLLVNKLGDPDRKIASKTGYLLTKLLAIHPGMKAVVLREVERFAFRPGLSDRARYYAIVYLNQMVLTHKDAAPAVPGSTAGTTGGAVQSSRSLAARLIDLYFTMFTLITEGKLGTVAKLAAAAQERVEKQAKERAARKGKKKAAPAAPPQQRKGGHADNDLKNQQQQRSGEMDARMLSALITGVRRAFPYVTLEEVEPLVQAHADVLFSLVHSSTFGLATQSLLLLYQLMSSRSSISDRFYRSMYSLLLSPELLKSTKTPMFLSLLFKALKSDVDLSRVTAFVKRLMQVALCASPGVTCGCLMLVSEVMKANPGLWSTVLQAEETPEPHATPHEKIGNSDGAASLQIDRWPSGDGYDMRKRDPQYCNARTACLWELLPLASHDHPSVAAMARTLLAGSHIVYHGDPLQDMTLLTFLDKFVQKKPKIKETKGDSLMQPLRSTTTAGLVMGADARGTLTELLQRGTGEQDVAPDEAFFHRFYVLKAEQQGVDAKRTAAKDKKKKKAAHKGEDGDVPLDALSSDDDGSDIASDDDSDDIGTRMT